MPFIEMIRGRGLSGAARKAAKWDMCPLFLLIGVDLGRIKGLQAAL